MKNNMDALHRSLSPFQAHRNPLTQQKGKYSDTSLDKFKLDVQNMERIDLGEKGILYPQVQRNGGCKLEQLLPLLCGDHDIDTPTNSNRLADQTLEKNEELKFSFFQKQAISKADEEEEEEREEYKTNEKMEELIRVEDKVGSCEGIMKSGDKESVEKEVPDEERENWVKKEMNRKICTRKNKVLPPKQTMIGPNIMNTVEYLKSLESLSLKLFNQEQLRMELHVLAMFQKQSRKKYKFSPIDLEPNKRETTFNKLIILDLDETIASVDALEDYIPDYITTHLEMPVVLRPQLFDFLDKLYPHFNLLIYSSGECDYVYDVINSHPKLKTYFMGILSRDDCCAFKNLLHIKSLQVVAHLFTIGNIIVVDDSPCKWPYYVNNLIPIPPFKGEKGDLVHTLTQLAEFIMRLGTLDDIRPVLKQAYQLTKRANKALYYH